MKNISHLYHSNDISGTDKSSRPSFVVIIMKNASDFVFC